VVVQAFDRDLRRKTKLGEAETGDDGAYSISYTSTDLAQPARRRPHVFVCVLGADDVVLATSRTIFNAADDQPLDVTVETGDAPRETEFARLRRRLSATVGANAVADLSNDELSFLQGATGVTRESLDLLQASARLARETRLPAEVFYGLGHQRLALGVESLLSRDVAQLRRALDDAKGTGAIDVDIETHLGRLVKLLEEAGVTRGLRTRRTITLALRDHTDHRPLSGVSVRATDVDARPGPRPIGHGISNRQGHVLLRYIDRDGAPPRRLRLQIKDRRQRDLAPIEIRVEPSRESVPVDIDVPRPARPTSRRVSDLASDLGLAIPPHVGEALERARVSTLADLRAHGGFGRLDRLAAHAAAEWATTLEAHAALEPVSTDVRANVVLIRAGYLDARAVARSSKRSFVTQARTLGLSADVALRIHERARVRTGFIDTISVPGRAYAKEAKKGPDDVPVPSEAETTGVCSCPDCSTAVSPRAYLVDLLDYTLRHLRRGGEGVSLATLGTLVHVPFGDLVDSCAAAEEPIRQIRLCIEVLRRAVGTPSEPVAVIWLGDLEARYRATAYRALLTAIGTSLDELRRSRGFTTEARTALAERLGFRLTDGTTDRLTTLLIAGDPTEGALRDLFGLPLTTAPATTPGTTPLVAQWRLAYLRDLWEAADGQGATLPAGQPIIDPDVVGPDDFRSTVGGGGTPFGRWIARRERIDTELATLRGLVPDVGRMIERAFGTSPPDLTALAVALDIARDRAAVDAAAQAILTATGLDPDGFRRLAELHRAAPTSPSGLVVDDWDDLVSLLVQSVKIRDLYPTWKTQEQSDAVLLGPADFWPVPVEPKTGAWPPVGLPSRALVDPDLTASEDLRDVTVAGLPAIDLWRQRATALAGLTAALGALRDAGKVAGMVKQALGLAETETAIGQELESLGVQLTANPDPASAAGHQLATRFRLTIDELHVIVRVKTAVEATSSLTPRPSTADWDRVIASLRRVYKEAQGWQAAEGSVNYWEVLRHTLPRWRATAAQRDAWRVVLAAESGSPIVDPDVIDEVDLRPPLSENLARPLLDARRSALAGLETAIDADLQAAASPLAWLDGQLTTLGLSAAERSALEARTGSGQSIRGRLAQIGIPLAAFLRLAEFRQLASGAAPPTSAERAEVRNILVAASKRRLFARWRADERAAGVTLAPQLFQRRPDDQPRELVVWRVTPAERRAWGRTLAGRIRQEEAVREALASAVGTAEEAALPVLRDALVWAAFIPDFLSRHSSASVEDEPPDRNREVHARWVSRRYQIDAEMAPCRATTRTAQAIETLQSLVWSVHTGFVTDLLPDLTLEVDDFDGDWRWMGSYPSWRGVMLAFIYPENILLPSLRRRQSPVFAEVVAKSRVAGAVTPADAEAAAGAYAEYLHDVCTMRVEATATLEQSGPLIGSEPTLTCVLIGRGATGSLYYAMRRGHGPVGFWTPIPGIDAIQPSVTLGTTVVRDARDGWRVLVFFKAHPEGADQVGCYALRIPAGDQPATWAAEGPSLLTLDRDDVWNAVVVMGPSPSDLPSLFVWGPAGVELRFVDRSGANWKTDDVDAPTIFVDEVFDDLLLAPATTVRAAVLAAQPRAFWLVTTQPVDGWVAGTVQYFLVNSGGTADFWRRWSQHALDLFDVWLGAQYWPARNRLSWYSVLNSQTRYRSIELDVDHFNQRSGGLAGVDDPIAWTFTAPGGSEEASLVAYERDPSSEPSTSMSPRSEWRLALLRLRSSGHVDLDAIGPGPQMQERVVPLVGLEVNPANLDGADAAMRPAVGELVALNEDASATIQAYLDEAYYAVPLHLAQELHRGTFYEDALTWFRKVYDYSASPGIRFTYPPLDPDGAATFSYARLPDWLADPLDVHAIAATRRGTDARFVLLSLIRCLLDYADAEFTRDTGEALARARLLYLEALTLLDLGFLKQRLTGCDELIGRLTLGGRDTPPPGAVIALLKKLRKIQDADVLQEVIEALGPVLASNRPWPERLAAANAIIDAALGRGSRPPRTLAGALDEEKGKAWGRHAKPLPNSLEDLLAGFPGVTGYPGTPPSPRETFCVPPNPVLQALRFRAELNLFKIHTCRNIAGQERALEPYAAPSDPASGMPAIGGNGQIILPGAVSLRATPYRYRVLIERARQLVGLAQQMEANFLGVLEKRDAAALDVQRARQEADVARASVRLQDLRVREAEHGVELAELQRDRASIQAEHFDGLLAGDLLEEEQQVVDLLNLAAMAQAVAAAAHSGGAALAGLAAAPETGGVSGLAALAANANAVSAFAQASSFLASALSTQASYERRRQDWELQLALARQDELIGGAQVRLARDQVGVVGQERAIAVLHADHADDVVEFLQTKFTSAELYDWMSGTLEQVYRYFLQQATAVARLAESQLAFERQETPPGIVQADYWESLRGTVAASPSEPTSPDRRGLTGSARLLQDVTRLDQYAFETDRRKLQLTKTISLARLDPFAFQRFRETGVMTFATPMRLFDRDFPGHYLRLIKRVRVSVVALIPPAEGIKATLATTGLSRVVIGGDTFQTTVVHRPPESVALTTPRDATGLFELEAQGQGEMLLPFEGLGVDTSWQLTMPHAANAIEYRTVADVMLTVEYTSLNSFAYRQEVLRDLDRSVSGDRPFSFRQQFADQWYDLNHPALQRMPARPMRVRFDTRRSDFPPNLGDLVVENVLLYFARRDGETFEVPVEHLYFTEKGRAGAVGGAAISVNGLVSTRQGNAGSWSGFLGKSPIGTWELALANTEETTDRFTSGAVQDILFVVTYGGVVPAWPA
jgi:hypothetical protein